MQQVNFTFPLRIEQKQQWAALGFCGIKRIDVVAYNIDIKQHYSFAGGHRHRLAVCRDDVHILFPKEDIKINIADVAPAKGPPRRRHDRR
jgi:hypothetical protein